MFKSLATLSAVVLMMGSVAFVAGHRSIFVEGVPVLWLCAAVAFLLNVVAFVPAYLKQSERYYDLVGSLTYLSMTGVAVGIAISQDALSLRQGLAAAAVVIWTLRLGTFLFRRVLEVGKDGRFDVLKTSWHRFLVAWGVQSAWSFLTAVGALIVVTSTGSQELSAVDAIGFAMWALGFVIEVVADNQKDAFRRRKDKAQPWIDEGLWSRARHPNYFGEILLWSGIFVVGASSFSGGEWLALISPLFTAFLLLFVSGVPMVDERALAKWGDDPAYLAYRKRTRKLVPLP